MLRGFIYDLAYIETTSLNKVRQLLIYVKYMSLKFVVILQ